MRKLLIVVLVIFTVAFAFGFSANTASARGGSINCYYTCSCNGVPLYCCNFNGVISCKVAFNSPIQCTQQAGC